MKIKSSLMFTAASVALFGSAMADTTTYVNIAGSTAGRSTIHAELTSASGPLAVNFNNNTAVPFAYFTTSGSAQSDKAKGDSYIYVASTGTSPTKNTVIVRCWWQGSASGVNLVSNAVQLDGKLLSTSTGVTTAGVQVFPVGYPNQTGATCDAASVNTQVHFGFSDVKQAATPYQTNKVTEKDIYVLPFEWVKTGVAALSGVSNITSQQARVHLTGGGMTDLSLFTGSAGDAGTTVYAVGRDDDSGTRITTLAETGAGVFATLEQYKFTYTSGTNTISAPTDVFNGGYASGGDLAKVLGATGDNAIGYVGISDGITATTSPKIGVALKYNGVPFSVDNVKNGSYTFWSKYQMIYKTAPPVGAIKTLFDSLQATLIALPTAGNGSSIKLTEMAVDRQADGGDVSLK